MPSFLKHLQSFFGGFCIWNCHTRVLLPFHKRVKRVKVSLRMAEKLYFARGRCGQAQKLNLPLSQGVGGCWCKVQALRNT